jgi:excisionase family DNA binding protein
MRSEKRGQDLRKIRLSKCYTIQQCSNVLGVSLGTVRKWLRQGLPTVPNGKPTLIPGDELKAWLTLRGLSRKQSCKPDELYCCRCRVPRTAKVGTVAIRALCGTCNTKMNKGGSLAKQSEIQVAFGLITPIQQHLAGCENPAVNQH